MKISEKKMRMEKGECIICKKKAIFDDIDEWTCWGKNGFLCKDCYADEKYPPCQKNCIDCELD